MIAALAWDGPRVVAGRVVRGARFVPRSTLPLGAACVVANGVREQLARLLAVDVEVDVVEPVLPSALERRVLFSEAYVCRVRGRLGDAFVALRAADARRLAALAFGERERSDAAPLSAIERATLERITGALVPLCASLCGTVAGATPIDAAAAMTEAVTYFEVRVHEPVRVAVGFALTRDPPEAIVAPLTLDELAEVELPVTVELASGSLGIDAFGSLVAGATLALDTRLDGAGLVRIGGIPFARGTCGRRGERGAVTLGDRGAA